MKIIDLSLSCGVAVCGLFGAADQAIFVLLLFLTKNRLQIKPVFADETEAVFPVGQGNGNFH